MFIPIVLFFQGMLNLPLLFKLLQLWIYLTANTVQTRRYTIWCECQKSVVLIFISTPLVYFGLLEISHLASRTAEFNQGNFQSKNRQGERDNTALTIIMPSLVLSIKWVLIIAEQRWRTRRQAICPYTSLIQTQETTLEYNSWSIPLCQWHCHIPFTWTAEPNLIPQTFLRKQKQAQIYTFCDI